MKTRIQTKTRTVVKAVVIGLAAAIVLGWIITQIGEGWDAREITNFTNHIKK